MVRAVDKADAVMLTLSISSIVSYRIVSSAL